MPGRVRRHRLAWRGSHARRSGRVASDIALAEVRKSNVPIAFIGTGERVPMDLREPSATSLLATLENSSRTTVVA